MAKDNVRASVIVYARLSDGWRRGSLVKSKSEPTGFRPNAMVFKGTTLTVEDPNYLIRTYEGSKAKYTSAGHDLTAALELLKDKQATIAKDAADARLGIVRPKPEEKGKTLANLAAEYVAEKKSPSLELSATSTRHYEDALTGTNGFVTIVNREFPSEFTKADIIRYIDHLKSQGYSPKTCKMRYGCVRGFLDTCGVVVKKLINKATHKRLSPAIEADTTAYDQADLDKLFTACDERHSVIFQFLLYTGLRYREANHLTWSNVDFTRNVIMVPAEQNVTRRFRSRKAGKMVTSSIEFQTKNRKRREVPIFAPLRPLLLNWRQKNPGKVYVFGSRNDMPDNDWLFYLKKAWRQAGLNCMMCETCVEKGECDNAYLHRLRGYLSSDLFGVALRKLHLRSTNSTR